MQAYKKAEEMTTLIEAAHALLSAVLVPEEALDRSRITSELDSSFLRIDQNVIQQGRRDST